MKKIIEKEQLLDMLKNRNKNERLDLRNCIFKDIDLSELDLRNVDLDW